MKKILTLVCAVFIATTTFAQKTDTVVVELAKTSRMVFTIKDKKDLEQLKQYDFQALFDDILARLEGNDSIIVVIDKPAKDTIAVATAGKEDRKKFREFMMRVEHNNVYDKKHRNRDNDNDDDDDDNDSDDDRHRYRGTSHSFNLDLGLNSYLSDGTFPDQQGEPYAIRSWGSWNIGINSVLRTRFNRHFYTDWGLGVSWLMFKFQNNKTRVMRNSEGITFEEDAGNVSFIKSKLNVTYLNASAIPMFAFGSYRGGKRSAAYRIGVGPYVGYRLGSSTKLVYETEGDRQRDRNRDNFYLNNLRYGVRAQIGIGSADFFFNYDMNELFAAGKGPKLNAFSFGITF